MFSEINHSHRCIQFSQPSLQEQKNPTVLENSTKEGTDSMHRKETADTDANLFNRYCTETRSVEIHHALSFIGSSFVEPFKMDKPLSIKAVVEDLSQKTHQSITYGDQTLVVLVTKEGTIIEGDGFPKDPLDLIKVVMIERSCESQAYAVNNLDRCPHFTLLTADLPMLVNNLQNMVEKKLHILFVPSHVTYSNTEKTIKVVNGNKSKVRLLSQIHSSFEKLFRMGLHKKFTLNDFGRGDVLKNSSDELSSSVKRKDRHIPTISVGYGTQDCTKYASNKMTIAGNNKPYLSDGGLSAEEKKVLYTMITSVLQDDFGKDSFNIDKVAEEHSKFRKRLNKDFAELLKGDSDIDVENFRIDGMTFIIGQRIAPHCDKQNSMLSHMNNAVTLTSNFPISFLEDLEKEDNADNDLSSNKFISLLDTLRKRGYSDTFPISSVYYSKSPIDSHVNKLIMLDDLKKKNDFNKVMIWAITERVNSEVDYRGKVLNHPDFSSLFSTDSKSRKVQGHDLLNAPFVSFPAAYDKMGYWSMILEFFNILVVNILTPCTIMHIVEFSMYCGVVCNGTSVPWRLMEEIMKDPKTSKNRFQNEFKNDLFLFLSALDTEVADYQHIEKSKGKKSVPKRRKRGSCEENRYQFNNHLQCLTLTDKDKVKILGAVNDAFNSPSKKLQSPLSVSKQDDKRKKKKQGRPSKKGGLDEVPGYTYFVETLSVLFDGVGSFTSQVCANVMALTGGIPLKHFNDASIPGNNNENTGPALLVKKAFENDSTNDVTPKNVFEDLYKDLKKIFPSGQITMNLLENTACELWRSFKATCGYLQSDLDYDDDDINDVKITVVMDDDVRKESKVKDLYYFVSYKGNPQNLFSIEMGREGTSSASPAIYLRNTGSNKKQLLRFTNWKENKSNVIWIDKEDTSKFKKTPCLKFSSKLRNLYCQPSDAIDDTSTTTSKGMSRRTRQSPNYFHNEGRKSIIDVDDLDDNSDYSHN